MNTKYVIEQIFKGTPPKSIDYKEVENRGSILETLYATGEYSRTEIKNLIKQGAVKIWRVTKQIL